MSLGKKKKSEEILSRWSAAELMALKKEYGLTETELTFLFDFQDKYCGDKDRLAKKLRLY